MHENHPGANATMSDRVTVMISDGVADVRLNRPEKHNALDLTMFDSLASVARRLSTDKRLRAVVLSGEGPSFCSGLDFPWLQAAGEGAMVLFDRDDDGPANRAQRAAWAWTEVPVPVIAALHGYVYGGGLQLAMATDIRFATPDARLSLMEIKWGLVPDMSGTQTMRHLVSLDVLKELTFTGRIVEGAEALSLGLVTHVADDPMEAARALADRIASRSPDAVRAAKRLLDRAVTATVPDGLRLEEQAQRTLLESRNHHEAVAAGLERRDPVFVDPD